LAFKAIQGHCFRCQLKALLQLPISNIDSRPNLNPISHRFWGVATYWPKIANSQDPFSFSAFARGDSFRIYKKALRILKLESFRQPTVKIWWS